MAAEQRVTSLLAGTVTTLAVFLASAITASLTVLLASAVFAATFLCGVTTTLATLLGSAYPEHTVEQLKPVALLGTQGDAQDHRP
jgi:hypothetical protein